jgi:sulfate transport system substrate-binding protein
VLTPNPFTSGAAKWNLLAAYGAKSGGGENPDAGLAYLRELITRHVAVQDKSGREALQNFVSGTGDVLLSYENEAILAQQQGEDVDYVVPDQTIKIENPVATVNESEHLDKAKAFVDFLYTPEAQRIFAAKGYRPVVKGVSAPAGIDFPTPPQLFEIGKFGGWGDVNDKFFDPEKGVVAEIFKSQGKSTASG